MGRLSPADFRTVYGFRRPDVALLEGSRQVCGLDYPFTLPRKVRSLGAARLVSTPSRLECFSGLGSGLPFEVSPNLSSSASPVSQASTQVFLKSAAYAIPPRPRGCFISVAYHRARRGNLHVSLVRSKSDASANFAIPASFECQSVWMVVSIA